MNSTVTSIVSASPGNKAVRSRVVETGRGGVARGGGGWRIEEIKIKVRT